jgi:hypothetical protein
MKTPRAQLEREIAKSLATPIQHRAPGRKAHAQKKAPLLRDIEPGLRKPMTGSSSGVTTIADRLFDGKAWTTTRHHRPNGTHFYQLTEMAGHRTDWPTWLPDGRVLYDRPQQIPSRVAAWVSRVVPRE